jgi:hypothetical protein
MAMMGLPSGFDSSKGKKVPGTDVSGVRVASQQQARQYMNRRGGYNRDLESAPSAKKQLREAKTALIRRQILLQRAHKLDPPQ